MFSFVFSFLLSCNSPNGICTKDIDQSVQEQLIEIFYRSQLEDMKGCPFSPGWVYNLNCA